MNRRLLIFSLLIPLFIACQAGLEIIPPESCEEGTSDFYCNVSDTSFTFDHAYDYTSGNLTVAIGEETVIVDLTQAPWMEVEGGRTTIDPNSEVTFKIAPSEPNYSTSPRSGVVVLKGKYTGQSVEIDVTQAGSFQDADESLVNKGGLNDFIILEHSMNSPVQILDDETGGTFTGIRPGDALLMRAPVKNLASGTDVSAMICIGHKTAGEKSKWVAEYWDEDMWNEIETFTTGNDTLDFNITTFISDFTLKQDVVNDYVKVRFRLVSGQDNAVYFIAASPTTGAALEINTIKDPVTITLDFGSSWPLDPVVDKSKIKTKNTYTYTENDVTYEFEIYSPAYGYYYDGSALRFQDQKGGYIRLPAIEGKALVELTVTITNTSNKYIHLFSYEPDMTSTEIAGDILSQKQIPKQSSATFKLTGTTANTPYYLYSASKHMQIGKIVMTYE